MKRIIFIGLVAMVLVILVPGGAWAKMGGLAHRLKALEAAVCALQEEIVAQQKEIDTLSEDLAKAKRMIKRQRRALAVHQSNPVLALRPFVSVEADPINGLAGPHIIFRGANVHIQSGSGATSDPGELLGLGNLIVGYNESRDTDNDRSGSHNIVVGDRHNFSSYGGLVAGSFNAISENNASVTGGLGNMASGEYSSVSGGYFNTASWFYSSVSGGAKNTASGPESSISGGYENEADGPVSSVSGGIFNNATGQYTSVSGGRSNTANGDYSSVSGGYNRSISGTHGWCASSFHAVDPDGAVTIETDSDIKVRSSEGALNLSGLTVDVESTVNTNISAGMVMNLTSNVMSLSSRTGPMDMTGSPILLNVKDPDSQRWAARLFDRVSPGGVIESGCPTVLIGD